MGGVISTPGLSQLFGCTPVGPVGWRSGVLSATAATAVSAFAPGPGVPHRRSRYRTDYLPASTWHPLGLLANRGAAPASASAALRTSGGDCQRPYCPLDARGEFVDIGCGVKVGRDTENELVTVAQYRDACPQAKCHGRHG